MKVDASGNPIDEDVAARGIGEKGLSHLITLIDDQIRSFNARRSRLSKFSNRLNIAQVITSTLSIAVITISVKYPDAITSMIAIAFSLISACCSQFLSLFNFHDRLANVISTVSRLNALRAETKLLKVTSNTGLAGDESEDYKLIWEIFSRFQSILLDSNIKWEKQLQVSQIHNEKEARRIAALKDIQ